jgi:hypothetical protein
MEISEEEIVQVIMENDVKTAKKWIRHSEKLGFVLDLSMYTISITNMGPSRITGMLLNEILRRDEENVLFIGGSYAARMLLTEFVTEHSRMTNRITTKIRGNCECNPHYIESVVVRHLEDNFYAMHAMMDLFILTHPNDPNPNRVVDGIPTLKT